MVLALGVLLTAAGLVLIFNLGGAGDLVMRRVTSRSLGDLAPGYAATRRGFNTYASLVLAIRVFALVLAVAGRSVAIGTSLIVLAAITFAGASVLAIAGEAEAYRALKR